MKITYTDEYNSVRIEDADQVSGIYAPLLNEGGVIGSITPTLHGDSKISQNAFLLQPVSIEDLHTSLMGRNVWFCVDGDHPWAASGRSPWQLMQRSCGEPEKVTVTIGKFWQKMRRENDRIGIAAEILSFCPAGTERAEIMAVTVKNTGEDPLRIRTVTAIPIYGRSADNIRDHRHVTSLLNRIYVEQDGIRVEPTMSFDERGHRLNHNSYGVYARGDAGERPEEFYPVLQDFIGEGGTLIAPEAVVHPSQQDTAVPGMEIDGREAMGALAFPALTLRQGEEKTYVVVLSYNGEGKRYLDARAAWDGWEKEKKYWDSMETISVRTGDQRFDRWMSWVVLQPVLRRICGCSFLPHHDYGRGGRGWRDLWQDSLALLLADPDGVREQLVRYFDGVRMDGSNATIIGVEPGEFLADRNAIVRVWMDHGVWPFLTTKLYIDQTGDFDMLLEPARYFKDQISHRGDRTDPEWDGKEPFLRADDGSVYQGTVLEHLLVQQLTSFYDVGEHGHIRLRGADWNDALDMAKERGESVAFTAAYAGNLDEFARLLLVMRDRTGIQAVSVAQELQLLFDNQNDGDADAKRRTLHEYCDLACRRISGRKAEIPVTQLAEILRKKAEWIRGNIRETEIVQDGKGNQWFNSYYDDHGKQVEGVVGGTVRMMLTGQVFVILSRTADEAQAKAIIRAADTYLYDGRVGGYRLNTDFHEIKMDMGRMFGFAYGQKENGAVFSHMAVMYGYSLYARGFAREGFRVLQALYRQCDDFDVCRLYPGIPEYFDEKGRGAYHYLTGAASWYVYTVLTRMYGVRGESGDLLLDPMLVRQQFDGQGRASVRCLFAGRALHVIYENPDGLEAGEYEVGSVRVDQTAAPSRGRIARSVIRALDDSAEHEILVVLQAKEKEDPGQGGKKC